MHISIRTLVDYAFGVRTPFRFFPFRHICRYRDFVQGAFGFISYFKYFDLYYSLTYKLTYYLANLHFISISIHQVS